MAAAVRWINGLLMLAIGGLAFRVSFNAISDMWVRTGAGNPSDADLIPLIVDGLIIVASLNAFLRRLAGERPIYPWIVVGAATMVSVVCNVAHAEPTWGARLFAAVIPIALCVAAEIVIRDLAQWLAHRAKRKAEKRAAEEAQAALERDRRQRAWVDPNDPDGTVELERVGPAHPVAHQRPHDPAASHSASPVAQPAHPAPAPFTPPAHGDPAGSHEDAQPQVGGGVPSVREVVYGLVQAHEVLSGEVRLDREHARRLVAQARGEEPNPRTVDNALSWARTQLGIPRPRARTPAHASHNRTGDAQAAAHTTA